MKTLIVTVALLFCPVIFAATTTFEKDKPGQTPHGWMSGITGKGSHRWVVEKDESAPSRPHVLKQSAIGDYPWIIKKDGPQLTNGFVEVKFKSISGEEDQAGGLVWRFKDGATYYVARANALENNVSIYYVEGSKRKTIKYVDGKDFGGSVTLNRWHTFRVEFQDTKVSVLLDGKKAIEIEDNHISGPGAVGLWTKADSVTAFDDFSFGGAAEPLKSKKSK